MKTIRAHGLEFKYYKDGGLWRYIGPISGTVHTGGPKLENLRTMIRHYGGNVNYQ